MAFGPMTDFCADIQVPNCLNDIIAKVEQRDYRNKQDQIARLIRHNKNLRKKASKTTDDWAVATEKIGQENSDLHNEIKRLKQMLQKRKILPKGWVMVELEGSQKVARDLMKVSEERRNLRKENENLKLEVKSAQEVTMAYMKRFDKLAEIKVERACSRIQCEDKFGHLIGRIPTDK